MSSLMEPCDDDVPTDEHAAHVLCSSIGTMIELI